MASHPHVYPLPTSWGLFYPLSVPLPGQCPIAVTVALLDHLLSYQSSRCMQTPGPCWHITGGWLGTVMEALNRQRLSS